MADLTKFQAGVIAAFATSQESWLTGSDVRHRIEGDPSISTVKRGLTRLVEFGVLKVNKVNGAGRGRGHENRYSLVQDPPSMEREPENPGNHPKEESGQTRRPNGDANLQDEVGEKKVVRDFTECPLYRAPVKLEEELTDEELTALFGEAIVECPSCNALVSRENLTKHLKLCEGHIYNAETGRYEELPKVKVESLRETDKKIAAALMAKVNPSTSDEDDEDDKEPREGEEEEDEGLLMPWMEDKTPRAKEKEEAGMFGLFRGYGNSEAEESKDGEGGSVSRFVGAGLLVASLIVGVKSLLK